MDTSAPIHLFSDFRSLGGGELHTVELARLLGGACRVWGNCAQPLNLGGIAVQPLRPFQGAFPRGGTLVVVGAYSQLGPWLAHARPRRLILVCNTSQPQEFYGRLAQLRGETGLEVELAYVSDALRQAMLLPGRLVISPIDLQRFVPAPALREGGLVLGRHSRDIPAKHHPGDISLYTELSLRGATVRLLGGSCLASRLGPDAGGVALLPAGAEAPEDFLRGLNCFFYRTDPTAWVEAGGRAVQEALACGLPVVAGRQGGYAEWIEEGENGFLCDGQEEAMAHLQALAADPALRRRLSQGARRSALTRWGEAARAELRAWYLGEAA